LAYIALPEKSVLHLGCTDYPLTRSAIEQNRLLHQRLAGSASSIVGVDADEAGIKELRKLMPGYEFVFFNAERLTDCVELKHRRFDLVVAADILEHVCNAGRFLECARSFLAPGASCHHSPARIFIQAVCGIGTVWGGACTPGSYRVFLAVHVDQASGAAPTNSDCPIRFPMAEPDRSKRIGLCVDATFAQPDSREAVR
jgi:hypothetical protein